jgi:hypothetical protein
VQQRPGIATAFAVLVSSVTALRRVGRVAATFANIPLVEQIKVTNIQHATGENLAWRKFGTRRREQHICHAGARLPQAYADAIKIRASPFGEALPRHSTLAIDPTVWRVFCLAAAARQSRVKSRS